MAANPQFKVNQLAKDLGLKSKDILDTLAEKGITAKTQGSLEGREFDILFDTLTKQNQIKDIDSYIFGDTYIPSKLAAAKEAELAAEKAAKEAAKMDSRHVVIAGIITTAMYGKRNFSTGQSDDTEKYRISLKVVPTQVEVLKCAAEGYFEGIED